MANNNNSGDEKINLPDYVINLVNEAAGKEGFSEFTITPAAGANHGDGFQSFMIRIDVNGKQKQNGVLKENVKLSMICKMPPLNEIRRKEFNSGIVFEREIYIYENILPIFSKFQREKGLSTEEGFHNYPKCYGTYSNAEKCDYAILMDDLRQQQYQMFDKLKTLTISHAKLSMEAWAKLHAITFALREQNPEIFCKLKAVKADGFKQMLEHPSSLTFFENSFIKAISTLDAGETELIKKMEKLRDNFVEEFLRCVSIEEDDPFGVICHGDSWNNNILFLYDENNTSPRAISLIDWQLAQYTSPVLDLTYFLCSSTEQSLRATHYDELLKHYHDVFSATLKRLGSDANKLFSFEKFNSEFKKYAIYGMLLAPMLVQIIATDPKDIPDLDEIAKQFGENNNEVIDFMPNGENLKYKTRMAELIRDFFSRYEN